jgi:[ribosomal protein S18]-alanine N-acetyltransferase
MPTTFVATIHSSPNNMDIRTATPADIPLLRDLDLASPFGARWTDDHYRKLFSSAEVLQRHVLVAEEDSTTIGYLAASGIGEDWELENVIVESAHQREGVAQALLAELRTRLQAEGAHRLRLEVRAGNLPARALYAALGFSESNRRTAYYSNPVEDAVILMLTLN